MTKTKRDAQIEHLVLRSTGILPVKQSPTYTYASREISQCYVKSHATVKNYKKSPQKPLPISV